MVVWKPNFIAQHVYLVQIFISVSMFVWACQVYTTGMVKFILGSVGMSKIFRSCLHCLGCPCNNYIKNLRKVGQNMLKNTSFGYNAWFQRGKALPNIVPTVTGPAVFATEECEYLLKKMFPPCAGDAKGKSAPAPFAVLLTIDEKLPPEGFALKSTEKGVAIAGGGPTGLLYGVYRFIFCLNRGEPVVSLNIADRPAVPMRMLNHWDNGNGTVERGYSGSSLFWKDGKIGYDLPRLKDYARLLSSIGINQISVNNVNVRPVTARLLTEEGLADLVKVADVFRPFGIRLIIAVHFDSPVWVGGLKTSDPTSPEVAAFWKQAAAKVYKRIPDLAGFLVKADSEFQSGPNAFGHTQDVGANVMARALQPFGGTLYWRCFIYDCQQDWRDTVTDRPKAAYDTFFPLDGKFEPNVVLQIKHGPSDFQVREPNSPLFGAMDKTCQALEFQITQEYTGQQKDLYAWAVQWQEVFEQPLDKTRILRDSIGQEIKAVVAVSNTGSDDNWCGHLLAQANLYAFGRMAWDAGLTAPQVTKEWVALTFGTGAPLFDSIVDMLLASRHIYEKYNAPLGIGWMVNVGHHYGPSVDGYEYMKWGTYHRANTKAIGVDRTRGGTGYTAQYHPYVRDLYENLETCPENMALYFHRLPYDYALKNGKPLIQHIYDSHFEGVAEVEALIETWRSLKDLLTDCGEAYESVCQRLDMQLENAREWRDVVNTYFYRKTGTPDSKGRKIYD